MRMPWLLCNIASGIVCALITEANDRLLQGVIVLAAFVPLVLTVTESIGVQAAELSVGLLRSDPAWSAFRRRLRTEFITALLLGLTCGVLVATVSLGFGRAVNRPRVFLTLLASIGGAMLVAATIGSFVPRLMRRFGADPKFASGPVTLMAVDVTSTLTYLGLGTLLFASELAALDASEAAP
jgi:magnesium transporter